MKIIVCIKQVPDTTDIKWTENNTLQRDGVESILNPYDLYAINEAVKLKKLIPNTEITALTMGPNQAEEVLKKAIALGCDRGILLSDKKFAGADTYATAHTLTQAIRTKIFDFDLILCGQFAIDGDTAQTGPSIAAQLGIPQVTFVKNLERCDGKSVYAIRQLEDGFETVKAEFPVLMCILKDDKEPPRPTINGIITAQKTSVQTLSIDDINMIPEEAGLRGSPTYVSKAFRPEHNREKCKFAKDSALFAEIIRNCTNE